MRETGLLSVAWTLLLHCALWLGWTIFAVVSGRPGDVRFPYHPVGVALVGFVVSAIAPHRAVGLFASLLGGIGAMIAFDRAGAFCSRAAMDVGPGHVAVANGCATSVVDVMVGTGWLAAAILAGSVLGAVAMAIHDVWLEGAAS